MSTPRVLVVSNQCFSNSTSNGRTLGTLFKGWPRESLRQFCISLDNPEPELCSSYFAISDKEAFKACVTLGLKRPQGKHAQAESVAIPATPVTGGKSIRKTAATFLARNAVWSSGLWKSRAFKAWLEEFKPQIVVFQSGDSAFMADIARKIAHRYNSKLLIFNTEGYIFFQHNYLRHQFADFLTFPLFRAQYRRAFMRVFKDSDMSVYLNGKLEHDYQQLLPHRSEVLYNSSEMEFNPSEAIGEPPTFAYLGNLGIKRPEALAEFAQVLQEIAPKSHIDVYGKLPNGYTGFFDCIPGIKFHGLVSYEKVKEIISTTDFLLHVEKDDPVLTSELRYAFSTKIADSVCSGRNFIVYAPASLASSKYIADTGAAWLATTKNELREVLKTALTDSDVRQKVLSCARIAAAENHSAAKNRIRFQKILCSL